VIARRQSRGHRKQATAHDGARFNVASDSRLRVDNRVVVNGEGSEMPNLSCAQNRLFENGSIGRPVWADNVVLAHYAPMTHLNQAVDFSGHSFTSVLRSTQRSIE